MAALLPLVLALGIPCSVAGCGGESGSQPAPVDATQQKKVQEYMGSYREQMVAHHKDQAKAKAKDAAKKSP
jgi:hypothetical protein